jgi:hypothetical protein
MRRHPKRFAARPTDPRARFVVQFRRVGKSMTLWLNCGHIVSRKMMCIPDRVVCTVCPSRGGIGGNAFQKEQSL